MDRLEAAVETLSSSSRRCHPSKYCKKPSSTVFLGPGVSESLFRHHDMRESVLIVDAGILSILMIDDLQLEAGALPDNDQQCI